MILPLTHEQGTVRRLPVVTFAVIAVCLLAHVRVVLDEEPMAEAEERYRTAIVYFLERPYLQVDPRLVPPEITGILEEMGVAALAAGRPSALQQGVLDEHTEAWIESLRRHPLWVGGLLPAEIEPFDLISHAFLHGGWFHLLGNILFLYFVGPYVEDLWGRGLFGAFYLAAAAVAGGAFALHYPNLFRPLVGASGAVAAVMGAFLLLHGQTKIRFFYFLGIVGGTFSAPAWVMLPLWFGGELLSAVDADAAMPGGVGGGVAYWAHVWGFVFGLGFALVLRVTGVERRIRPPEMDEEPRPPVSPIDPTVGEAAAAHARGESGRALEILARAARAPGASRAAREMYWDLARELRRPREAIPSVRRLIEEEIRAGDADRALAFWHELREAVDDEDGGGHPGPALAVRLADGLDRGGNHAEVVAELLREAAPRLGPETPLGTLMKAVRLAERLEDRELLTAVLDAALAHPHLPADVRSDLELQRPLR